MERIKRTSGLIIVLLACAHLQAQQPDSLHSKELKAVTITGEKLFSVSRLPKVKDAWLYTGKKNEVINVQMLDANIAEKTPRQIFSKVPGVFVYDMDGSGNQMNISTRGLDSHRGWEYNIRKNGIITNSDMYGYPASHYSMPMEAVDHIEMVRGTGSLQYGAQFGGMLNYVSKQPDTVKTFVYESVNSVGSFNMLSTFHAVTGTIGKFKYYAYYNKRVSDGYRENNRTDFDAQSVLLFYAPSEDLQLKAELARSNYRYQIPGPLTDSMFHADPRQSTRSRNYFNPEIFVPSISMDWKVGHNTRLAWVVSAVLGVRNSVQFDKPATTPDARDAVTLQYAGRQVDIDNFNSYTSELRLLHNYMLKGIQGILAAGIQVFNNDLHRRQLGKGTSGTDFNLSLTDPVWGRDLHLKTKNIALFVENSFAITPQLTLSPGLRMEMGESQMSGTIGYYDATTLPTTVTHRFPLFGINAGYTLSNGQNFYAGWSQAYRPVVFKDIIPASTYEIADKNLKDADGYNAEVGYRGAWRGLRWDFSLFMLQYNNRMGTLAGERTGDSFYILRTNTGNSLTRGAEAFAECMVLQREQVGITMFTSTAFFDSQYNRAQVRSGDANIDIEGNNIEAVPDVITRNGITLRLHKLSVSCLYSYTGKSYADPLNTEKPSATGAVGAVPAYGIFDVNASLRIYTNLVVRFNLNNLGDTKYFTKRPSFYPGPGVWSSDGRSVNLSLALKL